MFFLLMLELRTLYLDRDEHDREQKHAECEQLQRFGQIADGINASIRKAKNDFDETMKRSDKIMSGVQEDREAVTGSKTFAYFLAIPNSPQARQGKFDVMLAIVGKYPMKGMALQWKDAKPLSPEEFARNPEKEFHFNSIAVNDSVALPGAHPILDIELTYGTYQFDVFSLGGKFTEMLTLEKSEDGQLMQSFVLYKGNRAEVVERLTKDGKFLPKIPTLR